MNKKWNVKKENGEKEDEKKTTQKQNGIDDLNMHYA